MKKLLVLIVTVLFAFGVAGISVAATKKATQEEQPSDVKTQKAMGKGDKAKPQKKDMQKDAKPGMDKDMGAKKGQLKDKNVKPGQLKDKTQNAPAAEQKANTAR